MRTQKRIDARWTAPRFQSASSALLLVLIAAGARAASPVADSADDSRISVTAVAGQVDVTMAGNAVTVDRDATVLLPARIVTGHDGALGLTQAGTNITVSNDSDVEIPAEAVDGNLVARLVQHSGNVFYDVAPRDVGKLRVETPFLVAVIKGTQFNVAVEQDRTTISLFEGHLEIRMPDDSDVFELDAGEIAIRSLIDDSIRIIGMNDEIAAAPRAAEPFVAEAAPAAAQDAAKPVAAEVAAAPAAAREAREAGPDRVTSAADAVVADDRAPAEPGIVATGIELSAGKRSSVDPGPALVALDRRNDRAGERGPRLDLELGTVGLGVGVDIVGGSADVVLDAGIDIGGGAIEGVLDTDVADAALDLGRTLDLDLEVDGGLDVGPPGLDGGGPPGLDGGGPPGLDGGGPPGLDRGGPPGLDLDLDVNVDLLDADLVDVNVDVLDAGLDVDIDLDTGTVDLELPDRTLPAPRGKPGVLGLP